MTDAAATFDEVAVGREFRRLVTLASMNAPPGAVGTRLLLGIPESEFNSFAEYLAAQPGLIDFAAERFRWHGAGSVRLTRSSLATWSLQSAVLEGIEWTARALATYAKGGPLPCFMTLGVRGVSVDQKLSIANDIWIQPIDRARLPIDSSLPDDLMATAEIRCLASMPRAYDDERKALDAARAAHAHVQAKLEAVRVCVALVTQKPVVAIRQSTEFAASVPGHNTTGSGGWVNVYAPRTDDVRIDEQLVDAIRYRYERLRSATDNYRDRIIIAVHRWHSCLLPRPEVDVAIDLGIALEALLLPDEDPSELSYRLALRGARVLRTKASERKATFMVLKALYQARSDAVHRGRFFRKIPKRVAIAAPDHTALLSLGRAIVAELIDVMLERQAESWDDVEFS